jgi:hypothetical protein
VKNPARKRAKSIDEIEKNLKPCIYTLYGDGYRVVLRRIVEKWGTSGGGASFYDLYEKERVVKSKSGLKIMLGVLMECGYLEFRYGKPSKNSPKGKKEYYPTPLGIVMDTVLGLLHPEERGIGGSELIYPLAWSYVENTLFRMLPFIHDYMVQARREGGADVEYRKLSKGFLTALHAMNVLFLRAVEVEEKIGLTIGQGSMSGDLSENIKKSISGNISYLEGAKPRVAEGSVHYKLLEYLLEEHNKLARVLGIHGQGEGTTRINI